MKLNRFVVLMSVLGLAASPAFAGHAKHKSHSMKAKHHKMMTRHAAAHDYKDYKDMGAMPVQPAPVETCTTNPSMATLAEMTQNTGRAMPNPCNPGWYNRIALSGGANFDLGKWGRRSNNFRGVNYKRFSINDAYLNVSGTVNDWTSAFIAVNYADPTDSYVLDGSNSTVVLQQAYVTFANFNQSPFFVQAGKQFQDFGRYDLHPITQSLTQVMSQTLASSAKVGFITNGFHGSLAALDAKTEVGHSNKPFNYVAALGYDQAGQDFGWDVGAGYMYNATSIDGLSFSSFNKRVGAYALYGDVNSGPFGLGVRYNRTQRFDATDATWRTHGAQPWAVGVQGSYGFNAMDKNQSIYLGFQQSGEASAFTMARKRWLAGYSVDVFQNTSVGAEYDQDYAYKTTDGGTGKNGHLVTLRASVKFM